MASCNLVDGDPELDISSSGFASLYSGEESGIGPGMVSTTISIGTGLVVL